ncbi:MAG: hypothetical protein A2133_00840 [Actinobacteria bacterium RBG_16_64_13]|nr:MAG: hypothetical protein A2133_00840 [Actinobacteria bacterium RBG_16_64_13]
MDNVAQGTSETQAVTHPTQSVEIGELAAALAKAQAEFPSVKKDQTAKIESQKGSYSYTYADLASVLEAVRGPLTKNGLALVQPMTWSDEHPWLLTRLLHSSGQWIESRYPLAMYERPQEMGSAITYARRYTISALLGIAAEEDDDAAAAEKGTERRQEKAVDPKPPCPRCEKTKPVIASKYGEGWYCMDCKKGFSTMVTGEPGAAEAATEFTNKAAIPARGTRGRTDLQALMAECRRITGDPTACTDLLKDILKTDNPNQKFTADAISAAWALLESHPIFGSGK